MKRDFATRMRESINRALENGGSVAVAIENTFGTFTGEAVSVCDDRSAREDITPFITFYFDEDWNNSYVLRFPDEDSSVICHEEETEDGLEFKITTSLGSFYAYVIGC